MNLILIIYFRILVLIVIQLQKISSLVSFRHIFTVPNMTYIGMLIDFTSKLMAILLLLTHPLILIL